MGLQMIDISAQSTELLTAVISVVAVVFLVMAVSNKLAHLIRKNLID